MRTSSRLSRAFLLTAGLLAGCGDMGTGNPDPMSSNGAGGVVHFTASGEVLALGGYSFPPASEDDPAFVDGWDVKIDELLVTFGNISFSQNPDRSPADQSQIGAKVGASAGPWAVDLHKGGTLMGKGGSDEQAFPLEFLNKQNLNDDKPFDPTVRYAFSFDVLPASDAAIKENLDAQGLADYALMVQNGWTVLYAGTATFKGTSCTSTNPAYDFSKLPKTVKFKLGFRSPTSYINCQNPDNDPAEPFGNEEHQRGVQIKTNATAIVQATLHTDHPFWESARHDAPAHFDALAAHAKKDGNGDYVVTLEDVKGVNFTAFKDSAGSPLPWRSCLPSYTPPNGAAAMNFDSQGIPFNPLGDPAKVLRDYYDYMTYTQRTQGHLNADGLCFVQRRYPSPP